MTLHRAGRRWLARATASASDREGGFAHRDGGRDPVGNSALASSPIIKIPRYVHITDEFPMTVTGKVRKVEMREKSVEILRLPQ